MFAVIDALFGGAGKFHTRIEGRDFSPTEQRIITRLVDVISTEYEGLARHLSAGAGLPALGDAAPVRQHRHAQRDRGHHLLHAGGGRTSGHLLLHPLRHDGAIRDVLYSSLQGDAQSPTAAGSSCSRARSRPPRSNFASSWPGARHRRAAAGLQAWRLHRAGPAAQIIQAKVDGVPVFDCMYGTSNGRYSIKIDRLLTGPQAGWLGESNGS